MDGSPRGGGHFFRGDTCGGLTALMRERPPLSRSLAAANDAHNPAVARLPPELLPTQLDDFWRPAAPTIWARPAAEFLRWAYRWSGGAW